LESDQELRITQKFKLQWAQTSVYVSVHACVYIHVHMYMCTHIFTYTCIYVNNWEFSLLSGQEFCQRVKLVIV
jgi:hypothetical protein